MSDAPAWVAAVGTTGALLTSLRQIRTERILRHAADERVTIDQHREQARLVAAYMGELDRPKDGLEAQADRGKTAFYLANNSPEPVYSVVVGLVFVQGAGPGSL